jgi:hypothetical protein
MTRITRILKPAVFAAAVAGSLAFGTAQLFAAPSPAAKEAACSTTSCRECGPLGGVWVPAQGRCLCCG